MTAVNYRTTEKDWNRAIEADTLAALREAVEPWRPYIPDALEVVNGMDAESFAVWREGLAKERRKEFGGIEWAERFGCLLIPAALMDATITSISLGVPLGAVLLRSAPYVPDPRD